MKRYEILLTLLFIQVLSLSACRTQDPSSLPTPASPSTSVSDLASEAQPQPSHNPFDTQTLEEYEIINYRSNTSFKPRQCEPLSEALIASGMPLSNPVDVAVTPDGKTLYITTARCSEGSNSSVGTFDDYPKLCRQGRDKFETRHFIYRLHQGQLSVVREAGTGVPPLSCALGEDIEIDAQGNLYFVDLQQHWLYRLTPAGQLGAIVRDKEFSSDRDRPRESKVDKINGDPIEREGPRRLQFQKNNFYWALEHKTRTFASTFGSWKLKRFSLLEKKLEEVGYYSRSLQSSNAVYKTFLYQELLPDHPKLIPEGYIDEPVIKKIHSEIEVPKQTEMGHQPSFQQIRMNSKGEIYGTAWSAVYRIVPYQGSILVAGHENETGLNDGTGSEARFNGLATDFSFDAQDNLYVADRNNQAIRKITPAGIVTTVYGQK